MYVPLSYTKTLKGAVPLKTVHFAYPTRPEADVAQRNEDGALELGFQTLRLAFAVVLWFQLQMHSDLIWLAAILWHRTEASSIVLCCAL